MTEPKDVLHLRNDESIQERFPDRGEFPGNDVEEDPEAEKSPNTAHPE